MNPEHITPFGHRLLDRRGFFRLTGGAMGSLGLANLLAADDPTAFTGKTPIRPAIDPDHPYQPRKSHFPAAAKRVLVIFCPGAVSHVDTFDYKPALTKLHDQKPPGIPEVTFEGPAIILQKDTTTVAPPGTRVIAERGGNLLIRLGQ